jgi:hypothetical protein
VEVPHNDVLPILPRARPAGTGPSSPTTAASSAAPSGTLTSSTWRSTTSSTARPASALRARTASSISSTAPCWNRSSSPPRGPALRQRPGPPSLPPRLAAPLQPRTAASRLPQPGSPALGDRRSLRQSNWGMFYILSSGYQYILEVISEILPKMQGIKELAYLCLGHYQIQVLSFTLGVLG